MMKKRWHSFLLVIGISLGMRSSIEASSRAGGVYSSLLRFNGRKFVVRLGAAGSNRPDTSGLDSLIKKKNSIIQSLRFSLFTSFKKYLDLDLFSRAFFLSDDEIAERFSEQNTSNFCFFCDETSKEVFRKITKLNLSYNCFASSLRLRWIDFSKRFACCENLIELDLSNNSFSSFEEEDFMRLGRLLGICESIEIINSSGNELNNLFLEDLDLFGRMLKRCRNLTTLNLSSNKLNEAGGFELEEFGNSLVRLELLTNLNLDDNDLFLLEDEDAKTFCCILRCLKTLRVLSLKSNGLNFVTDFQWGKLVESLRSMRSLEAIDLSYNQLTCEQKKILRNHGFIQTDNCEIWKRKRRANSCILM
jgi:Leucine-rich repeat (LRR) protein